MTDLSKLSAAKLVLIHNAVAPNAPVKKFENQPRALVRTEEAIAKAGFTARQAVELAERLAGRTPAVEAAPVESTPAAAPAPLARDIRLTFAAVDGYRKTQGFRNLAAARTAAHRYVGEHPEIGSTYAVSGDGIGKVTCVGCTLAELFPERTAPAAPGAPVLPAPTVLNLVTGETLPRLTALHGPVRQVEGNPVKAARAVAKGVAVARKAEAAEAPAKAADSRGWKRTNATVPQMLEALRSPEGVTLAELTVVSGWEAPVEMRHLRKMETKRGFKLVKLGEGRFRAE